MNILTIGISDSVSNILNIIKAQNNEHEIIHLDNSKNWDWIIVQGHDDPGHWKSILCAVNANASSTPITVLSSHIDGTRLRTPVCSMHSNGKGGGLSVSRCAMQSLLENEKQPLVNEAEERAAPIVFEYHSPCR